jgi:hypothetical protein
VPTVPGKTCADLLPDAAQQEAGDGICELIQQSEGTCCPVGCLLPRTTACRKAM